MNNDLMRSRLYDKTLMSDEESCWPWLGARNSRGYGSLRIGDAIHSAHRVSYIVHKEPIPEGMHVIHACDQPSCVNPNHLSLGTHADNMDDRQKKGRTARGSNNGKSKLTESDVRAIKIMLAEGRLHTYIAERFPITRRAVGYIASGDTWAHVTLREDTTQ